MSFVSIPGLKGKVYVPEKQEEGLKKHPCKECYFVSFAVTIGAGCA